MQMDNSRLLTDALYSRFTVCQEGFIKRHIKQYLQILNSSLGDSGLA